MKKKETIRSVQICIIIVTLFIAASYITQKNIVVLEDLFVSSHAGMFIYVVLNVIGTVLAQLTIIPMIPIASAIWGPVTTAILSIIGWTGGAIIALGLARRYGQPLVERFISLKKIKKIERWIPERNLFFSIIVLRMMIPVDILSYVLGIFSQIRWRTYISATIIGITPGAFMFAYLGQLPFMYQMVAFLGGGAILALIVVYLLTRKKIRNAPAGTRRSIE